MSHVMPFQQRGIQWLRSRKRSLLGDEQGLGKTVQALKAVEDSALGTVVVCPATLKSNWAREVEMWTDLKPVVLSGKNAWHEPKRGEVVIINYDILPDWLYPKRIASYKTNGKHVYAYIFPDHALKQNIIKPINVNVVFDEAQYAKNAVTEGAKSTRARKAMTLAHIAQGRVIGMTGTPLDSKPGDLFGIIRMLGMEKDIGLETLNDFQGYWGGWPSRFGFCYKPIAPRDCGSRLAKVMLRRLKRDVMPELPRKEHFDRYVDIDGLPRELVKRMDAEYQSKLAKLKPDEMPKFEDFSAIRRDIAVAKIPAMLEFIEEYESEPLVVCSAHTGPIKELIKLDGWNCITGETGHGERARIVSDFQAGKLKGIGITTAAWAGITLTRAKTMLFVSLDWKPGTNQQGEDRIHRIGQSEECRYFRLVADHPLERRLHSILHTKLSQQDSSVNAARRFM